MAKLRVTARAAKHLKRQSQQLGLLLKVFRKRVLSEHCLQIFESRQLRR
jgi:hypothetical protein